MIYNRSRGFTFVEVLIGVAITATLTVAIASVILVSSKTLKVSGSSSAKKSKIAAELQRLFDNAITRLPQATIQTQ